MFESFIIYILFFTRIPIPYEIKDFENNFRRGVWMLPVFGFLYGLIPAGLYALMYYLLDSRSIALVLAILIDVIISGAMHYDGLADMADGLFSSRDPEKMKTVMRDSRIGTFGSLALILYILLFFSSMHAVLAYGNNIWRELFMLAGVYMVGKTAMAFLHWNYRYANESGQGKVSEGVKKYQVLIALALGALGTYLIYDYFGLIALSIALLITYLYKCFVYRKISGMTGDTLGASSQIASVSFLMALLLLIP